MDETRIPQQLADEPIDQTQAAIEEPLSQNIKNIIGGVATLVALVVPIILIRKLVRKAEESKAFKAVENTLL